MNVNDPLSIEPWHDQFILKRGNSTFFDEDRYMLTFTSREAARIYALLYLHEEVEDEATSVRKACHS